MSISTRLVIHGWSPHLYIKKFKNGLLISHPSACLFSFIVTFIIVNVALLFTDRMSPLNITVRLRQSISVGPYYLLPKKISLCADRICYLTVDITAHIIKHCRIR